MPELPEVETIRIGLSKKILGKKIISIKVGKKKLVRNSLTTFKKNLIGNKFEDIKRRGKLLIVELSGHTPPFSFGKLRIDGVFSGNENNPAIKSAYRQHRQGPEMYLLVHLRMTGQLVYQDKKDLMAGGHPFPSLEKLPNKYSHVILTFADKSQLFFNDQRQFGYIQVVDTKKLKTITDRFGLEPLVKEFTWKNFQKIFKIRSGIGRRFDPGTLRKTAIKNLLLNQQLIAGIGNIYADEICFASKIKPQKSVKRLTLKEKKLLFENIPKVLKKAIKNGGTTFSDYRDAEGNKGNFVELLKVYQRTGKKCKRCKTGIIRKIKLGSRGTHLCSVCQK